MKLVLFCAASAAALSPNGKLPVMKIVVEGSPPFDAVAHFEGLAADSDVAVAAGAGEDGAGPGARVLIDGDAALFGAGDMGEDELRSLLAMHETLKDDAGLDEAAEAGVPGGFDLHDIVRSMVEEDSDDA